MDRVDEESSSSNPKLFGLHLPSGHLANPFQKSFTKRFCPGRGWCYPTLAFSEWAILSCDFDAEYLLNLDAEIGSEPKLPLTEVDTKAEPGTKTDPEVLLNSDPVVVPDPRPSPEVVVLSSDSETDHLNLVCRFLDFPDSMSSSQVRASDVEEPRDVPSPLDIETTAPSCSSVPEEDEEEVGEKKSARDFASSLTTVDHL